MNSPKSFIRIIKLGLAIAVLLAFALSCDSIMDNSSANPHSPVVSNLKFATPYTKPGGPLSFSFEYYDAGADIENLYLRDKHSRNRWRGVPPDEEEGWIPFPGTSGNSGWYTIGNLSSHQLGEHTLVLWVEDSEGSISNLLEAKFYLVL